MRRSHTTMDGTTLFVLDEQNVPACKVRYYTATTLAGFLGIDYPTLEKELRIVRARVPDAVLVDQVCVAPRASAVAAEAAAQHAHALGVAQVHRRLERRPGSRASFASCSAVIPMTEAPHWR